MASYSGPYAHELQTALRAVQSAAKISQSVLRAEDKGTVEKSDLSPVTIADFAVQALLASSVRAAFPADGLVGEESAAELRADPALLRRVWELLLRLRDDYGYDEGGDKDKDSSGCGGGLLPRSPEDMCEIIDRCGSGEPGASRRVWVFDPIDGTKTFVRREAYAINVALLEDGKQVLSVVGCPTLSADADADTKEYIDNSTVDPSGRGSIVSAIRGQGTYIRPLVADDAVVPRKISPRIYDPANTADLRVVSCYSIVDSGVDAAHDAIAAHLGITSKGHDLLSWVLRWVTLGLGLADVTVWVYKSRERTGKIWDHAGAMLLFEEIGGKITDVDGKDIDLSVGRKMTGNHGFVAAPSSLHHVVLEAVRDVLHAQGKAHLLA
ncbi:carbohydrate phosphatase [Nemania serpens]|nr:carbohydrate phosphatase [Nemania serpens]